MESEEHISALRAGAEALPNTLAGLTEDELAQITGGYVPPLVKPVSVGSVSSLGVSQTNLSNHEKG